MALTSLPTRTASSLGASPKQDRYPVRDAARSLSAAEYEDIADAVVAVCADVGTDTSPAANSLKKRMNDAEASLTSLDGRLDVIEAAPSAPVGAQYVTLATNATLTSERVLTVSGAATLTDGGAGGNATIAVERTSNNWALSMPSYGTVVRHYRRTDCCGMESGITDGFYRISGSPSDASLQEAGTNGVLATGVNSATAYARLQGCTTTTGTEEIMALATSGLTHRIRIRFKIPTLSNSSHRFHTILGMFGPAANAAVTDGLFLFGDDATNSGNWVVRARASSVDTDVNSAVALDTNWHTFEMQASNGAAQMWLDGVSLGSLSTGFPTTNLTHGLAYGRTVGTSSARRVNIDWIDHAWAPSSAF